MLMVATIAFVACTGQGGSKSEKTEDSATVAISIDSTVQDISGQAETAETAPTGAALNSALFGKWSNNDDPLIYLVLKEKNGTYDGRKGYGYLTASNEYYETDFILVFTSIAPDGENIKVHYNKLESYCTGDLDDFGNEDAGEWVEEKVGEGDLTIIPQGNKVKIDSSEKRIKNKVLSKAQ